MIKRLSNHFKGLYWRQLFVTAGMVILTLFLLGASFFSLSYNYARGQRNEELAGQAQLRKQMLARFRLRQQGAARPALPESSYQESAQSAFTDGDMKY